jgi:hypothetical protein
MALGGIERLLIGIERVDECDNVWLVGGLKGDLHVAVG